MALPVVPLRKMTVEEYLAYEHSSPVRHEFRGGELIMMAGETPKHARIQADAARSLGNQLVVGNTCELFGSDMPVKVNNETYYYPDVSVMCGGSQFITEKRKGISLTNPTLIIEVLSPSTEIRDRNTKMQDYFTMPSVQEYILIAQDSYQVEQYVRQPDGKWAYTAVTGRDAELPLPSIGCTLKLADVYLRVNLETGPSAENGSEDISEEAANLDE